MSAIEVKAVLAGDLSDRLLLGVKRTNPIMADLPPRMSAYGAKTDNVLC